MSELHYEKNLVFFPKCANVRKPVYNNKTNNNKNEVLAAAAQILIS
jgi:hypothetical protein